MTIRRIKADELTPDPVNANKGTERGSAMLEDSLRQLGAGRSILVDKNGVVIAGNKSLETAVSIGLDDVILVQTDGTKLVAVQRTDLDLEADPRAKRLALADNRIGQVNLDFDAEILKAMMEEDPASVEGLWREDEIAELMSQLDSTSGLEGTDTGQSKTVCCPECGCEFAP